MTSKSFLRKVVAYYSAKLREYGASPQGVDWASLATQRLRFEQLLKIAVGDEQFSINDYGCGYGALLDYLKERRRDLQYCGYDVSSTMIQQARRRWPEGGNVRFCDDDSRLAPADYCLASGVFNVRLDIGLGEWDRYVLGTIDLLSDLSIKGFAFNVLSDSADPEHRRVDLYYADPGFLFDYCRRRHSRKLAILHDYGLYEFTVLVRKA